MRPRLHVPIPEPKGSEFENFDRLAGILMRVKPKKKKPESQTEAEQAKSLAFSLSASLAFRSLPLLALSGKAIPRQATARNLRTHDGKPLRVVKLAPVVAERLLIQIPEQVERFHADVRAVQLSLNQTPKVLHRVRMDVAAERTLRRGQ